MKKLIAFVVLAAAFAVVTAKAAAPFTITGMATFNKTNYMKGSNYVATTTTMSLNNAFLYLLISNAVAHASNGSNGIAATLPADGYISYFPEGNDGKYNGYFYVTDKKSYYYPLSGIDANATHYSFMELKALDQWLGQLGSTNDDCCCCCCPPTRSIFIANYSELTGKGTYKAMDTAELEIHTDPYWGQHVEQNRISLVGTFNPSFTLRDFQLWTPSSATFTGGGDINIWEGTDNWRGILTGVSAKFSF